jgi:hypothetical protein
LIWYAGATRCKLKGQWSAADYAEQESSDDEDTSFDIAARLGSQIEAAPVLDRVVSSSLLKLVLLIQCIMSCFVHPNVLTCEYGNSMLVSVVELERILQRTSDSTTLSLLLVSMNV